VFTLYSKQTGEVLDYYLYQVNGVHGGHTVFVRCVRVCLFAADRSLRPVWALNANSSKTAKATDFKFDVHVSRDSPDMTPSNFSKMGHGQDHVTQFFGR